MSWLKRNFSDLLFLLGIIFLNIPIYMISMIAGLSVTGLSFIVLSLVGKGGD